MELRDEQREFVTTVRAELKFKDNALAVMSTGSGKTVSFSALADAVYGDYRQLRVLFLVDRLPLVDQIESTLKAFHLRCGVYCGSLSRYELDPQFIVSTIQTISRIQVAPHFDLVVVDEAHSMTTEHYEFIARLRKRNLRMKVLGVTATPYDAKGYIYGEKKFFKSICFERGLNELTTLGRLVPAKLNGPKLSEHVDATSIKLGADGDYSISELETLLAIRSRIESQVTDALPRAIGRKKIIWACVSIKHARMLEEILNSRAESAVTVASDVSLQERHLELGSFTHGDTRHLCFVSVVAKGFDFPPIDAVVFLRPTRSPALYVQIVGRGLRTFAQKQDCLVLDYCRVVETNGPLDAPFIKGKGRAKKSLPGIEKNVQAFHCDSCGAFYFGPVGTYPKCPECGQAQDTEKLARAVQKQERSAKKKSDLYSTGAFEGILWHRIKASELQDTVGAVSIRLHLLDTAPIPYFDLPLPTHLKGTTLSAMGKIQAAKRMLVKFFGQKEGMSLPKMVEALRLNITPPDLNCLSAKTHKYMMLSFSPKDAAKPSAVSPQMELL